MIDFIYEPLQYAFMIRGFLAAVIVGIVCAIVGTYVVLRGMAFFGSALAHSILPGVAIGYLAGAGERRQLFWWALLAAIVSALGIGAIGQNEKIKNDTAIGIIFSAMFALGIALISSANNYSMDLTHFLFGDILGVSNNDLVLMFVFAIVVLLIIFLFYKEFKLLAFDPLLAKTLRLPTKLLNNMQLILIALVIVVSLQIVGIALMVAMLVTPPATAHLLTKRLSRMMLIAILVASISGIIGLYTSYYLEISSGAAIVLTATVVFSLVWILKNISSVKKIPT